MPSGSRGTAPSSRRSWLLVAVLVLGFRPAGAQSIAQTGSSSQNQGIEAGRLSFYPALFVNYGYDDNIFYATGVGFGNDKVSSRLTTIQPRLLFDLPMGQNWVRWSYSPLYRNYSTSAYVQTDPWSHYFDLDGHQSFGARGFTNFRDRFVEGRQELQEIDPGGELTFGLVPFRTHQPTVEVGMHAGARQAVSAVWTYDSTQFEDASATGLYNSRGHGLEGRYTYTLSPDTNAYLFYGRSVTVQARGNGVDVNTMTTGVGLAKTLNRSVVTQVTAGYEEMDFTGAAPGNYAGPILTANATWQIDDITSVSFIVRRQPYQSYYLNNNFYLNRNLAASMTRQAGATTYWMLGVELENNIYPVGRRDRGWRAQAGIGFQMSRTARAFLAYNYSVRSSNVLQSFPEGFSDPFNYSVNRVIFRVEVGFL